MAIDATFVPPPEKVLDPEPKMRNPNSLWRRLESLTHNPHVLKKDAQKPPMPGQENAQQAKTAEASKKTFVESSEPFIVGGGELPSASKSSPIPPGAGESKG